MVQENSRYIMRITGDDEIGKAQLDNFIDPESKYPVIATTSKLMTTGVDAQTCKVIVLDSNIESMTEFKQIIGRGTRVREDFGKSYFTILDFRNVTKLFADPDFDGEPVKVYETKTEDDFEDAIEKIDSAEEIEPQDNETMGTEISSLDEYPPEFPNDNLPKKIIHTISGQEVRIIGDNVKIMGSDGKLITESLTDYTKNNILGTYSTLDGFLQKWSLAKQKYYILEELADKGVPLYEVSEQFGDDADMFDVVLSIAYGQKPVGRKTRAANVRAGKFLNKYQGKAREVIEALLDKYESNNLKVIEEKEILKVQPFNKFGTPLEIAESFGGINGYENAVAELEKELYKETK
jgi:type I restriction enzyme R subunit